MINPSSYVNTNALSLPAVRGARLEKLKAPKIVNKKDDTPAVNAKLFAPYRSTRFKTPKLPKL